MLNMFTEFLYAAFIYVRFYQLLKYNEFESINKIHFAIHLAWLVGVSIVVAGQYSLTHRKLEIAEFISSFSKFLEHTESK
jgi:hypothetical protein